MYKFLYLLAKRNKRKSQPCSWQFLTNQFLSLLNPFWVLNMKQIFVILLFCFFAMANQELLAQDTITIVPDSLPYKRMEMPKRVNNIIKTNPFALLIGNIPYFTSEAMLVNETTVSLYQSVFIGVSYLFKSPFLILDEQDTSVNPNGDKLKVSGWRVQAGYKFYINGWMKHKRDKLKGLAPKGLYVAPHISYSTAKITDTFHKAKGEYFRITFFNIDVRTGYQLLIRNKFAIDAFTGFGYKKNDVVYHDSSKTNYPVDTSEGGYFYNSNFKIVFGFIFGFAY